jgi:AraC-like DNA-binding protein
MKKSDPHQRVIGPLAAIPAKLAQMGVGPDKVFDGLAIRPSDLVMGNLVPCSEIVALLARCAEATDCPHFGLLLGEEHDHRSLGLLGELMAYAQTLGEALQDFVNWQIDLSRAAASYLYRSGDEFFFGYGIYERNAPGSWQVYDLTIAVGRNIVSGLSQDAVKPEDILISHRAPADRQPYERILHRVPRFDQSQNCLILSDDAMRYPLRSTDPVKRAAALETLGKIARPSSASFSSRARHFLRSAICTGDVTTTSLARQLDVHPKTLERRLAAEDNSFERIRDDVRYAVARDLLALTDLQVGEVAFALSFATHSAFDHAFMRWSGMSPSDWRTKNAEQI